MRIEIIKKKETGYNILIDNNFFRYCKTYTELSNTINSLLKAGFYENADGFL
ncbi:MAG: hypothetical protein ACOC3Z_00650 [Nanoarchaeota archaeon]